MFLSHVDADGNAYITGHAGQPGAPVKAITIDTTGVQAALGQTEAHSAAVTTLDAETTVTADTSVQSPVIIAGNADGATARTGGIVRAPDVVGATTNTAGVDLVLGGGLGHGSSTPGAVVIKVAAAAASGDHAQSRAEVARWTSAGLTLADLMNVALSTGTGTKIGTAAGQKLAFWGANPVAQQAFIADPAGGGTTDAEARTAIASILDVLIAIGAIAAA